MMKKDLHEDETLALCRGLRTGLLTLLSPEVAP